jgi:hypothetical protein
MINRKVNDILKEISSADDITKPWPKFDLLISLKFPLSVSNNICERYWINKETVTLAELFEIVISSEKDPRPGYLITKMLDFRCVGIKTFLKIVNSLSGIDFGKRCNLIWENKYKMFLNAYRVRGSRKHSWSSPINEEGKVRAKFRNGTPYMPRHQKKPQRNRTYSLFLSFEMD